MKAWYMIITPDVMADLADLYNCRQWLRTKSAALQQLEGTAGRAFWALDFPIRMI